MTDNLDDMNEVLRNTENAAAIRTSMQVETGDDFEDDDEALTGGMGSDGTDSADAELTPNDIFGLDPLDVLTLEELAEYLKVSPAAVRRVMKEQNLPGRNFGGEWRFLRDAVANWLRGQEPEAKTQQKARVDYSKPQPAPVVDNSDERDSRPPKRPYQSHDSTGGEYRPRTKFSGTSQQYGNQGSGQYGNQGGGQYGNRGSGQYGSGGGQSGGARYGGGQTGGGQYAGGQSGGEGQYRSGNYGSGGGGGYSPPPRRPYRAGGNEGTNAGGAEGGGGYQGGGAPRFGGGGYVAGGQNFSGGPKRKNKRQVFDNERGKRLDRRKQDDAPGAPEGQE